MKHKYFRLIVVIFILFASIKVYPQKIIAFFVMDTINNANHADIDIGVDHDYYRMYHFFKDLSKKMGYSFKKYTYLNFIKNRKSTILNDLSNLDCEGDDIVVFCNACHGSFSLNSELPRLLWGDEQIDLSEIKNVLVKKSIKKSLIINSSCNSTNKTPYKLLNSNYDNRNFKGFNISNWFVELVKKQVKVCGDVIVLNATIAGQYGWANSRFGNYFFAILTDIACDDSKNILDWQDFKTKIDEMYKIENIPCNAFYVRYTASYNCR